MSPVNSSLPLSTLSVTPADLTQGAGVNPAPSASGGPVGSAGAFTQALASAIGNLAGLQTNADSAAAGVALNGGVDIHQAMIAMEQASLGMHLAVQVRDKAVEAYQSLMNMQV